MIEPGSSSQFPFAVPENGSFEAEPKKGPPQPSWRPVRPNNKQTHSPPPAAKSSNEVAAGTAADGADKGGIKASTERSLDRKGSLKVTLKFGGTSFPLTAGEQTLQITSQFYDLRHPLSISLSSWSVRSLPERGSPSILFRYPSFLPTQNLKAPFPFVHLFWTSPNNVDCSLTC